jgi:hypothetical protein
MNLFGFEIKRAGDDQQQQRDTPSFAPPTADDGAVVVAAGGAYGTYVDLEGTVKSEAELVNRYREMSMHPEVDSAVDDIVNEAIINDPDEPVVKMNLDNTKLSTNIKKVIESEFNTILELLNFNYQSYDVFRRWYVDGRLYYHVIINIKDPSLGIQELRYVDPRKLRKIKEVKRKKDPKTNATTTNISAEYYLYSEKNFNDKIAASSSSPTSGLKIAKDSIVQVTSGLMDVGNTLVLSYLHKAIKPLNQLRTLEDACVIYRISRAPERRIFYIDVGNLPKMKAEQYLRDMMIRHKNRLVYDASSGEIRDDRKFMTMLEDYWLPRREGGRGTEITTLPAGEHLGEMGDIEYFQTKLYQSLNVPASRLKQDTAFALGRASEISRDEVKFARFISRLRLKFSTLFLKCLEKQLVLKGIISTDDWEEFSSNIKFDFNTDNYFAELKESEILKDRLDILSQADLYAGKYLSHTWIRKHILRQSDADIEEMDSEIKDEMNDEQYNPPVPDEGQPVDQVNAQ